jgi:hypothetical protein
LPLSKEALQLLAPAMTPRRFFDLLAATPLLDDAIRFLAAALPKREAVGWGAACVKDVFPKFAEPNEAKALTAAEAWTKDPSEGNRQTAGTAAEAAGYDTAPGCLAAAAFWSGGSLAPPHLPAVPPRDDLTGNGVTGAILLASAAAAAGPDPAKAKFIALGADVASGRVKVY